MKLLRLRGIGYKNLSNKPVFDFNAVGNCIALIGPNGSGKSNVIEAVSLIKAAYFNDTPLDWHYELEFELDAVHVALKDGQCTVNCKSIAKNEVSKYRHPK